MKGASKLPMQRPLIKGGPIMQNLSSLSTTNCSYDPRQVTTVGGAIKRIARIFFREERLKHLKSGAASLLTTLTIGSVFLAATYFFLIQLAQYGW